MVANGSSTTNRCCNSTNSTSITNNIWSHRYSFYLLLHLLNFFLDIRLGQEKSTGIAKKISAHSGGRYSKRAGHQSVRSKNVNRKRIDCISFGGYCKVRRGSQTFGRYEFARHPAVDASVLQDDKTRGKSFHFYHLYIPTHYHFIIRYFEFYTRYYINGFRRPI